MTTQLERARQFRALHARPRAFLIPNPFDAGSARLLAQAGFEALATTSGGHAFTHGRPDGTLERERVMRHIAELAAATELPLSADLEDGLGAEPAHVAETIALAAAAGAVGGSIEDVPRGGGAAYPLAQAIERVAAAVEAARRLDIPFTLTARCDIFLVGRRDLAEALARLQAYQQAGADVLYAPALRTEDEVATLVRSVDRPVNVLATPEMTLDRLSALGVRRVSVGSLLARAAYGALLGAIVEMRAGSFRFAAGAAGYDDLSARFGAS